MISNSENVRRIALTTLLCLLGFLVAWLWWVPMRCLLDGNEFQWGSSFGFAKLGGNGMLGDFPILVLLSAYIISMIYLGWRGARLPFHIMLFVWCAVEFATATVSAVQNPEAYRFRGDTFGIDISLALVGPTIWGILLLVALFWGTMDLLGKRGKPSFPKWTRTNTLLIIIVFSMLPVQFLLFQNGQQHGLTDKIALGLTIMQWVLFNFSLMPWPKKELNLEAAV